MSEATPTICPGCGKSHLVQQHAVSVHNSGTLRCPDCGGTLMSWSGLVFYTLAISPPKSNPDLPVIDE
jgi:hypothetical protein